MRIALGLEYDGSRFLGWQTQPGGQTVQDCLEGALSAIADSPIAVVCAGRTDRGVHAREQVVHFDTDSARPLSAWVRGANALLPESVAVLWATQASEDFHARYSATMRTYRYVLLNRSVRPGLAARHVGWYHRPLDLDRMREASAALIGQHDFSAFRSSECQARSPVRTLYACDIEENDRRFDFVLRANAFLHHMVRNIVGTLIYVGKGKYPTTWPGRVLASGRRAEAAPTFSAEGLYLENVTYAEHWNLPQATPRRLVVPAEL